MLLTRDLFAIAKFLLGVVHILYNAREGGGWVDNLLYALYGGGELY